MKRYVVSLVIGALVAACTTREEGGRPASGVPVPVVAGVTVSTAAEETVPEAVEVVGTVKARTSAAVAARIPGVVASLRVREGDHVARGELLATIEAAEPAAGAAGAEAAVEEARQGLEEARARERLADATYERYRRLFAEQAVTRQEFDGRQTEREVAERGVARATARLKQAEESRRTAASVAGYAKIASPLAGVVTGRHADPGTTLFPGQPLVTIEEEGRYRLELPAPEALMGKIRLGAPVAVAIAGSPANGRVVEVVPTVDPASRTFTVKIDVSGTGLRSGMYGRASFPIGSVAGVVVPAGSIRERGSLTSVWVVNPDHTARMRLVKTGKRVGNRVEILAGLSPGERIVTAGGEKVVEGGKVE